MSDNFEMPVWRSLTQPAEVAEGLVSLYRHRGASNYDEVVSQQAHAAQSGAHAMASGADDATVVAAFLHDIGHLLLNEHERNEDFLETDLHHEEVGARFLSNWFGDAVTSPVQLHVPAKRYLCATEPEYHATLSPASVHSLVVQGGPMTQAEVVEFDALPFSAAAVDLRRWDDLAKVAGAPAPDLDAYAELIADVLS